MAIIDGTGGFNPSTGSSTLFVAYGNDLVNLSTGLGYSVNLTAGNRSEFATFLDNFFQVNGIDNNHRFNRTTWIDETLARKAPIAKFILSAKTRLFLGNVKYNGTTYASRVWYSDLPKNNDIQYGIEYGTDLQSSSQNTQVSSAGSYFVTRNIKPGDPLTITTGPNSGQYTVASIGSETTLTLVETLPNASSGDTFWVGQNWFDVNTNDGDTITGLGANDDRVLCFKRRSLWRYDGLTLRQVQGVPGTTSHRSIVNVRESTFYFHPTGVYMYDGTTAQLISRAIQPYIDGVTSNNYSNIVAWPIGLDTYRVYLGNVNNTSTGLTVNNCFLDYNTATQTWSPGSLTDNIVCRTLWLNSNIDSTFLGDDSGNVFQDQVGYSDNGVAIPWSVEIGYIFPTVLQRGFVIHSDVSIESEFTGIQVHADKGRGTSVFYKLYGTPDKIDKTWRPLGSLQEEITNFYFDRDQPRFAKGINIKLSEESTTPGPVITRVDVFNKPTTKRFIKEGP